MDEHDFQKGIAEGIAKEKLARHILGVSENDGPERIKKAFWLLAMQHHPDRTPGDRESERRFQNIANAYDYLAKGGRAGVMFEEREAEAERRAGGYRVENPWGYYLWWRDNYFDDRYGLPPREGEGSGGGDLFARVDPRRYEEWYRSPRGARIDEEEKASLARLLGPGGGSRLLDVGCGTGHFTRWFAAQGYRAVGIDLSREFTGHARRRDGALYALADGSRLPFADNAFHAASAIAVLEFARFPEYIVREMRRVAEGAILILMLNPDSDLNAERGGRRTGPFASARFWKPDAALRFMRDLFPEGAPGSIRNEIHVDFHVVRYARTDERRQR